MMKTRIIPCLLLSEGGLVKTVRFKNPTYVGDPINAVKIFNTKEVDELVVLDIGATGERRGPDFAAIQDIVSEAFMPVAYGGGISTVEEGRRLFALGIEKVVINSAAVDCPDLIGELAARFGSQSVVASIDVKQGGLFSSDQVLTHHASKKTGKGPASYAREMEKRGAGEIFLTSVDRDGTQTGYDCLLIKQVADAVEVPLVACGGAGKLYDFALAVEAGASAVAAGSMFVYHGPHRAVLISYPNRQELEELLP